MILYMQETSFASKQVKYEHPRIVFYSGGVPESSSIELCGGSENRALLLLVKQLSEKKDEGERMGWERPFAVTLLTGPTRMV